MAMTIGEFQGLVATVGFNAAEAALNAAGGFSTPTPAATPAPTPTPVPTPAPTPNVEPASVSAFTQLERSGRKGTDLMERGNRRISMRDGSTTQTVADFFNNELNDEQKAFVNGWDGGIWTFASSAQDMTELKRNLNFHFRNAPETVGKEILQVDQSSTPVTQEGKDRMAFLNPEATTTQPINMWDYGEFGEGSSNYAIPSIDPSSINYPEFGVGSSNYANSSFLNALNDLNQSPGLLNVGEESEETNVAVTPVAEPTLARKPWNTMPANSLEQLYGKMNQGFYTTDSSGHYNSLTVLYRDAEKYLKAQGMDPSDQQIYGAMRLITQGAARQEGSTVADEYFWYDRNIESWKNEGRPVRPGGPATAPIPSATPEIETGDTTVTSTDASGNILDPMFNVDTTSVPAGFTAEEWNGLTDEQKTDFRTQFGDGVTTTATPAETPFTGSTADAGVGGPSTMDIFGQMQTQENFPADVFRRFLAEQVSPSGELQALSPFMMRGAQDLAPQLMSEYSASMYNPSNWTDAGNQTTFGDWLRAGERPTRQGMFNTLQDIGSVISGGQQGITAPGLSLGESLRRQNIFDQFGTETADSRKALQGLFSTAALRGVAPAFRYPVQSAAQNLFQTQRALQPEQSFLSFLGERL
tara:strand:+ start:3177 stop:5099 length:1923 start_codon:yes stop_codon:yes gene_type:complete